MAAERPVPLMQEVAGGFIARPIAIVDGEIRPDSEYEMGKRRSNRNRVEHNVFTYTGHEHPAGWFPEAWHKSGGGRGKDDAPRKKPKGYSNEFWEKRQGKKWSSNDMTLKKR